jgi:hypothetical protein
VDLEWRDGKLVAARLAATESKPVKVRYAGREIEIPARAGKTYLIGPDLSVRDR